jgi:hypothetical protein
MSEHQTVENQPHHIDRPFFTPAGAPLDRLEDGLACLRAIVWLAGSNAAAVVEINPSDLCTLLTLVGRELEAGHRAGRTA